MDRREFVKSAAAGAAMISMPALSGAADDLDAKARALVNKMTLDEMIRLMAGKRINMFYGGRGWPKFKAVDTRETSAILAMHALGVPAYCALQVVTRLYYSMEDVRTPVRVGAGMVLSNLALNLLLVGPLGASGLALATAISATASFTVLALLVPRRLGIGGLRAVLGPAAASLVLAAAMGACVFGLSIVLRGVLPERGLFEKLTWVLVPIALGLVIYLGGAWLLRLPEAERLRKLGR